MFTIKKKSKKAEAPDFGTVTTGQIGPSIGTVKTGPIGGAVPSANPMPSSNFKGADIQAIARLRAAKKKPAIEGDVDLGPTEVKEEAQAPRNSKYLERLRKRAK